MPTLPRDSYVVTRSRPYLETEDRTWYCPYLRNGGCDVIASIPEAESAQLNFFNSPVLSPSWTSRMSMRLSMLTQRLFSGVSLG